MVPGIWVPYNGVPDRTVQAISILPSGLPLVSPSVPGLRRRFPQLAGADQAVNIMRQQPVLMVQKEKEGDEYQ